VNAADTCRPIRSVHSLDDAQLHDLAERCGLREARISGDTRWDAYRTCLWLPDPDNALLQQPGSGTDIAQHVKSCEGNAELRGLLADIEAECRVERQSLLRWGFLPDES
jgi:hypothetical protein